MKKSPLAVTRTAQLLSLLAATSLATQSARADDATWAGLDGAWETIGNWVGPPAAVPGTGNTATFSGSGVTTLTTGATVRNLIFDGSTQNYNLTGLMALDAGGGISVANTANVQSIASTTFTPGGSFTITNNSTTPLTYPVSNTGSGGLNLTSVVAAGPVSGTTALTFDGTGVTVVSGAFTSAASNSGTSLTSVTKNGSGNLVLGNASNTNVFGGFTLNGGTTTLLNVNALSNRGLNLAGGNLVFAGAANPQSFNSANALINVSADTQITYASGSGALPAVATAGNWRIGGNAGAQLTSTGTPAVTFNVASPNINGFQLSIQTQNFNGTWKLGQNGALSLNQTYAPGSAGVHLNMGDAGTGSKYFASGAQFTNTGATQTMIPVKFGALSGNETNAIFSGRQNLSQGTTGTQYEIGHLNTNTSYAGTIRDGHTSNGNFQTNGLANGTNQVAPFASTYNRGAGPAGVQGTTEFVKVGNGTLTLTGANSHTAGTVIKGGRVAVSSDAALGATYDGSLRVFQYAAGTGVYNNTDLPDVTLSGGSPTTAASAGVFSGTFGNNANGNLFLSFSSQNNDATAGAVVNNQTGSGYISVPTVAVSNGTMGTAGTVPVVTVRVQGLLTLDGGTLQTDAGITSNRAVVIGAGGGAIETMGFNSTLSGNINGAGNLALNGGGKVTLSSPVNALTGTTTVGSGTTLNLALSSLAGSITVDAGGSLTGTGSAVGATINGTIAPGNSLGTLTFAGDVSLSGTTDMELDPSQSPNSDEIIVISPGTTLTYGGTLNVTQFGGTFAVGQTFDMFDAPTLAGTFSSINLPALPGGWTWQDDIYTLGSITIVPEAGTTALLGGVMLTLLNRRRRRA